MTRLMGGIMRRILCGLAVTFVLAAPFGMPAAFAQAVAPGALSTRPPVAPEYREAAEKRAAERRKLAACGRLADERKILVRDRTKFLAECFDKPMQ